MSDAFRFIPSLAGRKTMNDSSACPWIIETTDDTFAADVLERSETTPVVVDFWASWCAPCRMLGPILEQLADEFAGRFVLVKADTERTPIAASQFRVQSIPAVYGLRHGRIVDGFLGAMPENELREWLARFLPGEAEQLLEQGLAQFESDPALADHLLHAALAADPRLDRVKIALAQLSLQQNQLTQARQWLAELEKRGFLEPEADRVRAALELHDQGEAAGDLAACRQRAAAAPDDLTCQLELATALAAHQQYAEALEIGLTVVQRDRGDLRQQARQMMVDVFRLLPDDSELTRDYRRRLSTALY